MDVMLQLHELKNKSFEEWIRDLHNRTLVKVQSIINPKESLINYDKLKFAAVTYAYDSLEVVTNIIYLEGEVDKVKEEYDAWYDAKYIETKEELERKGQKSPAVSTIASYVKTKYPEEYLARQTKIRDIESKYKILEKMEKHWMKAADVYNGLIYSHQREQEKFGNAKTATAANAVRETM